MLVNTLIAAAVAVSSLLAAPLTANVYAEEVESTSQSSAAWLQVTPVSSRVVLKPGTSLDYSMLVSNVGTGSFKFNVSSAPYSVVDENYNISFSNETNRTQLSRWIKFIADDGSLVDEYTSTVDAGSQKTVNYRITVPEDVPAGGQYATILTQTVPEENSAASTGIQTVSRIGLVVYGRTDGETNDSAELADYQVPIFMNQGPITATSLVKNTGNTDFEVKHTFTVKSIIGTELYTEEDAKNVLPETERRANFEWKNTSAMGVFQVTYKVEAFGQTLREETHFVFVMPIYVIVIAIILLTIFVIWLIMLIRKRRERKSRLMV